MMILLEKIVFAKSHSAQARIGIDQYRLQPPRRFNHTQSTLRIDVYRSLILGTTVYFVLLVNKCRRF
ncbi:hypothetical protein [Paenibacillus ehimensis]|uniref:Uncharacterized protein n=1 Tax=Paenibacillus ehimensis TaxID=79264 RepID=A0ABT8V3R0_9BACL|nr:hypothetical protein [Paenibacillus ehimensis]MDO3676076.1 hypothetical protein [Paenibacillus ehimensis]